MSDGKEYTTTHGMPAPACRKCGGEMGHLWTHICIECGGQSEADRLRPKHATAREDYARACHALDEAHGMLKDARAELAALKQRLAGLDVWELRDESFPSSYGEYIRAADLREALNALLS